MSQNLIIKNIFFLSEGKTVFACERAVGIDQWSNRKVFLTSEDGKIRDEIQICGERIMSGPISNTELIAIETNQVVRLTEKQAQSESWYLTVQ
jgi:hypothetical protein